MNTPSSPFSIAFPLSAVVLTLMALFTLPVATVVLPPQPALMAIFLGSVFLLDGLTAIILVLLMLAGSALPGLAWAAAAYAFTAVIAVMQLLAFPGVFGPEGLFGVGPQASVWLWVAWHVGFPVLLLVHVADRVFAGTAPVPAARAIRPVVFSTTFALALGVYILLRSHRLPPLMEANYYGALLHDISGLAAIALSVLALVALVVVTRLHAVFDRWLALGMYAFTLDVVLALAGEARYSAGWYVSRAMSLLFAGALLVALLTHSYRLYRTAAQRTRDLQAEVIHDALTGLLNRRGLLQQLEVEMERARRHGRPLSLLFIDMDHFKQINDTLGHAAGDFCLQRAAQQMCSAANRHCDVVARFGGEEFVVLLPECDSEGARTVAERIRTRVEAAYDLGLTPCRTTVSVGMSCYPHSAGDTADALVSSADSALYEAKRGGRNRVVESAGVQALVLS